MASALCKASQKRPAGDRALLLLQEGGAVSAGAGRGFPLAPAPFGGGTSMMAHRVRVADEC